MHAVSTDAGSWFEAVALASAEPPARRRMVRALRQRIDLKFAQPVDGESADVDPALYDGGGRAAAGASRPGQLLNLRA